MSLPFDFCDFPTRLPSTTSLSLSSFTFLVIFFNLDFTALSAQPNHLVYAGREYFLPLFFQTVISTLIRITYFAGMFAKHGCNYSDCICNGKKCAFNAKGDHGSISRELSLDPPTTSLISAKIEYSARYEPLQKYFRRKYTAHFKRK